MLILYVKFACHLKRKCGNITDVFKFTSLQYTHLIPAPVDWASFTYHLKRKKWKHYRCVQVYKSAVHTINSCTSRLGVIYLSFKKKKRKHYRCVQVYKSTVHTFNSCTSRLGVIYLSFKKKGRKHYR